LWRGNTIRSASRRRRRRRLSPAALWRRATDTRTRAAPRSTRSLDVRTQTNGSRTYLLIVDNVRKVKQRVLHRLGRLDELLASGHSTY
jgi:hypothetical protein